MPIQKEIPSDGKHNRANSYQTIINAHVLIKNKHKEHSERIIEHKKHQISHQLCMGHCRIFECPKLVYRKVKYNENDLIQNNSNIWGDTKLFSKQRECSQI